MKVIPQSEEVGKLGVKLVVPYVHLDPAHKGFLLLGAPRAEAVRDFRAQSGFFHFSDSEPYLVTPIRDLLKNLGDIPTIYP